MPTLPDLFERLAEHGEHAGADAVVARAIAAAHHTPAPVPVIETVHARRHRLPRSTRVLTAAALTIAIIAVPLAVGVSRSHTGTSHLSREPSGPPYPPAAAASVATLSTFHWSEIAAPPIPLDASNQLLAWAGNEVVVFGEDSVHEDPHGSGAAYSPATDTWRRLPRAPLAGAWFFAPSWAWTGKELIVFPTTVPDTTPQRGEAYSPRTNSWRVLAPAPLCTVPGAGVVWTGRSLVVAGGYNMSGSQCSPGRVAASASYDPQTDHWTQGPQLPVRAGDRLEATHLLWADDRVVAITGSQQADLAASPPVTTPPATASAGTGAITTTDPIVRAFSWRPGSAAWRALPAIDTGGFVPTQNARWSSYSVGSQIVIPPAQVFCGEGTQVPCNLRGVQPGRIVDVATSRRTTLSLPPSIDENGLDSTAFSGSALVASVFDDPASTTHAFAWDVATGLRVELAAPPRRVVSAVWTGTELIGVGLRDGSGPTIGLRLGP